MIEWLVVMVVAFLVIALATVVGPRFGIASPLVLVGIGVAISFIPAVEGFHIDPEWILEGVLPPLLYSAAVSMPAMNFRREFGAIGGLSVILVLASSLLMGLFFMLVIPGLGFAWGVALGAIISPTDAVATSIIKRTPVSRRVIAMLDGESLLNDATALVLLRTAVVAAAASISVWAGVGAFAYSVIVAVVIGALVGMLNLMVRRRVQDPAVNTLISFTVPFLASVPASLLGGSGLVAAVVAGLVTGIRAPRELSPQNRLSDTQNWRTVELVLEGFVFLIMGMQMAEIVDDVERAHEGVWSAALIATIALVLVIAIRGAYVAPLLLVLKIRSRRTGELRTRLSDIQERLGDAATGPTGDRLTRRGRPVSERRFQQFTSRVRRTIADIDYFEQQPLGWREGAVVVWAGMRGAVTVAAAQTLPADTPGRSQLVLIAFLVALMSLVIQGGTVGWLVRVLGPEVDAEESTARAAEERTRLFALLRAASDTVARPVVDEQEPGPETFDAEKSYRLAVIAAQRTALLDARDNGEFDADVLAHMLAGLDASQIDLEMRGGSAA